MNHDEVEVTVYRITGRQLFFTVSQAVCEECDLTVDVVKRAVKEFSDVRVRLIVKPWLNNLLAVLLKRALHPPIVLIDGKVVSQGFVPSVEGIKVAIRLAAEKKGLIKSEEPQVRAPVSSVKKGIESRLGGNTG